MRERCWRSRVELLCLEGRAGQTRLPNDRLKRPDANLVVVWHRDGGRGSLCSPLHHHVASAAAHLDEAVLAQDCT